MSFQVPFIGLQILLDSKGGSLTFLFDFFEIPNWIPVDLSSISLSFQSVFPNISLQILLDSEGVLLRILEIVSSIPNWLPSIHLDFQWDRLAFC